MRLNAVATSCQRMLLRGWRNPRIIHKESTGSRIFHIKKGKPPLIGKIPILILSFVCLFILFKILEIFIMVIENKREIGFSIIIGLVILCFIIYQWVSYLFNSQIIQIADGKISIKQSPIPSFRVKVVNRLDVGNIVYDREENRKKGRKARYRMLEVGERTNFIVSTHTKTGKEFLAVTGFWTPEEVSKFATELREALQV